MTAPPTITGDRRIEYSPVEDLEPHPRNPRKHRADIEGSLRRFGFTGMLLPCPAAEPVKDSWKNWQRWPVTWEPATVTREYYSGIVHSLEVAEDHNYVADGVLTHNCLSPAEELDYGRRTRTEREDTLLERQRESGLLTDG